MHCGKYRHGNIILQIMEKKNNEESLLFRLGQKRKSVKINDDAGGTSDFNFALSDIILCIELSRTRHVSTASQKTKKRMGEGGIENADTSE